MESLSLDRQQMISLLLKSSPPNAKRTGHSTSYTRLAHYTDLGHQCLRDDPEFLAHMTAWNRLKGSVRDSQVALPVLAATTWNVPAYVRDNGLAHCALLPMRQLEQALRYAAQLSQTSGQRPYENAGALKRVVREVLARLETQHGHWNRVAVQARQSLKAVYALSHATAGPYAKRILFQNDYPPGSVFAFIARARALPLEEVLEGIIQYKIPSLVADAMLGSKLTDPDAQRIYMSRLTPTDVVRKTKKLQKLGVMNTPATRAMFEQKLAEASAKTPRSTLLNATRAAESLEEHGEATLGAMLRGVQERQFNQLPSLEGNWLILGDCSPSMEHAIDAPRQIAAFLARRVHGKVHVIYFNESPRYFDATGLSYEAFKHVSQHVTACGMRTSIGCGVAYAQAYTLDVDGIVIVSDGGENHPPFFVPAYQAYCQWAGKEVPIYFYWVQGNATDILHGNLQRAQIPCDRFDANHVDAHGLMALAETMRTNRYSLIQEIYDTPLLTLAEVFAREEALV